MSLIGFVSYTPPDGHKIRLGLERVTRWETRSVYSDDGADFLYFHTTLEVICIFNPAGIATRPEFEDWQPGQPIPADGTWANEGIKQLRDRLLLPRGQLVVEMGDVVVMRAPDNRPDNGQPFANDAKNGPVPLSFDVLQIHGGAGKTALCRYAVECWWSPCADAERPALLSHRWETIDEIDFQYRTTRHVHGTAYFRTDYLNDDPAIGLRTPDHFRQWLIGGHPPGDGMQRQSVRVNLNSANGRLDYALTDVEQFVSLGLNNPVVRIEGNWSAGFGDVGFFSYLPQGTRFVRMSVQCWGRYGSKKTQLMRACLRAVGNFGLVPSGLFPALGMPPAYYEATWNVALHEPYAELNVAARTNGALSLIASHVPIVDAGTSIRKAMRIANFEEDFPEDLGDVATAARTANPRPPLDGARGTFTERMIAQALNEPCSIQLKAQDMRSATLTADRGY